MTSQSSLIVLEFNELTPSVMDRFIADGKLPNFAALKNRSQVFVTDAEESPPNLEPWIQWVTVHTGLPYREHGIFLLGDSSKIANDSIWDVAGKSGKSSWICGSMNASRGPDFKGTILPDPWSVHVRPNDPKLLPYFEFVRSQVMDYTRTGSTYSLADAVKFLWFMVRNGLRLSTVWAVIRQLWSERAATTFWKRATILDRLQFDVFRSYYKRAKPDLSTFFLNSTAHYQHVYWRNMDPAPFSIKPSAAEQKAQEGAVLYGYQSMDRIVGDVLKLARPNATIVLASALGQQPCLTYENVGGKCFYKPEDYKTFLRFAGIDPERCAAEPVMSEEFHIRFDSEESARIGCERLRSIRVLDRPALNVRQDGASAMVGCCIFSELPPDASINGPAGDRPFRELFYFVDTKKSGMHHPRGIFWVATPDGVDARLREPRAIGLVDVAPTLLKLIGLQAPPSMRGSAVV
jgi:hypothetical protein